MANDTDAATVTPVETYTTGHPKAVRVVGCDLGPERVRWRYEVNGRPTTIEFSDGAPSVEQLRTLGAYFNYLADGLPKLG